MVTEPILGGGSSIDSAVPIKHGVDDPSSSTFHLSQPYQHPTQIILPTLVGKYHVFLLERNIPEPRAFVLNEENTTLEEMDLDDWVEEAAGCVERAESNRGTGICSPSYTIESQRRKRAIPRKRLIPHTKRRKCFAFDSSEAQRNTEDEEVSSLEDECEDDVDDENTTIQQAIRISDLPGNYYELAFKHIGQLDCKEIAKMWIRTCHPRKQTTNPYNGGDTREFALRYHGFEGALTAPAYWPRQQGWEYGTGCRHKEPDHIKKGERLTLLKHLLCCDHCDFTLEKLQKATRQIERGIPRNFNRRSINVLKDLYRARAMEIKYRNDEIDDMTILVSMPKQTKTQTGPMRNTSVSFSRKGQPKAQVKPSMTPTAAPVMGANVILAENVPGYSVIDKPPQQQDFINITPTPSLGSNTTSGIVSLDSSKNGCPASGAAVTANTVLSYEECVKRHAKDQLGDVQKQAGGRATSQKSMIQNAVASSEIQSGIFANEISVTSGATNEPSLTRMENSPLQSTITTESFTSTANKCYVQGELNNICRGFDRVSGAPYHHRARRFSPKPDDLTSTARRQNETPKPTTFSGSSSGLAGLPIDQSWPVSGDIWTNEKNNMDNSVFSGMTDAGAAFMSYPSYLHKPLEHDVTNDSFGSGFEEWHLNQPFSTCPWADRRSLEAEYQQQYQTYLPSNLHTLSMGTLQDADSASFQGRVPIKSESKSVHSKENRPFR